MIARITCAGNSNGLPISIRNACNVFLWTLRFRDIDRVGTREPHQPFQPSGSVDKLAIGLPAQSTEIMELVFSYLVNYQCFANSPS